MIYSFYEIILLFFIYSFLGWCVEVAFVAITSHKIENRGFLNSPICPIYGVGMVLILMLLVPIKDNLLLLYLGGVFVCSAIELFGGWTLDKVFHMRWWDYSDKPLNIGGYICLRFSVMWGIGAVFAVEIVHPLIMTLLNWMPFALKIVCIGIFVILFIIDMVVTLKKLFGIKKDLGRLDDIAGQLHNMGDQLKDVVGASAISVAEKAEESKEILEEKTEGSREKWAAQMGESRDRLATQMGESKEKWAVQMEELESKKNAIIEMLQKRGKHIFNSHTMLNKSGKSINIKEYINSFKRK